MGAGVKINPTADEKIVFSVGEATLSFPFKRAAKFATQLFGIGESMPVMWPHMRTAQLAEGFYVHPVVISPSKQYFLVVLNGDAELISPTKLKQAGTDVFNAVKFLKQPLEVEDVLEELREILNP